MPVVGRPGIPTPATPAIPVAAPAFPASPIPGMQLPLDPAARLAAAPAALFAFFAFFASMALAIIEPPGTAVQSAALATVLTTLFLASPFILPNSPPFFFGAEGVLS